MTKPATLDDCIDWYTLDCARVLVGVDGLPMWSLPRTRRAGSCFLSLKR